MSVFVCLLTCALSAPPADTDIARWIAELSDSRFSVRENATKQLWEAGKSAELAVRKASTSKDPETARRAKQLIEKYDWGIFADTAPEIVDAIGKFRGGDAEIKQAAIKKLIELGKPGLTTIGRLATSASVGDDRAIASEAIAGALNTLLPKLMRSGDLKSAEEILLICVASESPTIVDHYVAVVMLADRLSPARAIWDERLKHGEPRAVEIAFALARAAGDYAAARKIAESAKRADLVECVLWDACDWKALATSPVLPGVTRLESQPSEPTMTALFHRLAGNTSECEAALERLRKLKGGGDTASVQLLIAHGLVINERTNDAIPLLKRLGLRQELHALLFARGDYAEALSTIDPPDGETSIDRRSVTRIQAAQTAAQLGRMDRATTIFESLTQNAATLYDRQDTVIALDIAKTCGLTQLARTQAARYLDALSNQNIPDVDDPTPSVMSVFLPTSGVEAAAWWRFFRQRDANEPAADRLARVLTMLNSSASPVTQELATDFLSANPSDAPAEKVRWLHALAFAHKCGGQEDLARGLYRQAIEKLDNSTNRLKLADFERGQKRYLEAAEAYGKIAEDDSVPTVLYLQARCLADAGKLEEAKVIGDTAFRMSAGQFMTRAQLSLDLEQRGLVNEARREREFFMQVGGGRDDYTPMLLRSQARDAVAKHDYARAASLFERCLVYNLRFGEMELTGSHNLVRHARLNHARASLAAGQVDQALAHANSCLSLQPNDVSVPMHMFAGLIKHGRQVEANHMYRRVAEFHRARLKEFPDSALLLNNLAWCSACCRQDLDEAFTNATRATKLHEQQVYFDTLAEVCHQRGDKPAALVAIRKALSMDPTNAYYAGQLRRIEAGDRDSLPAEPEE